MTRAGRNSISSPTTSSHPTPATSTPPPPSATSASSSAPTDSSTASKKSRRMGFSPCRIQTRGPSLYSPRYEIRDARHELRPPAARFTLHERRFTRKRRRPNPPSAPDEDLEKARDTFDSPPSHHAPPARTDHDVTRRAVVDHDREHRLLLAAGKARRLHRP